MERLHVAVAGVVSAFVFSCGVVSAQQAGRVYRIGWLAVGSPGYVSPPIEKWAYASAAPFRDSLRDAGYVAGKNLLVDRRHANGDIAQLSTVAEALAGSGVDALVGEGTPPTIALMQATRSIPIIFLGVGFPVEMGIVASLATPGGNVTGTALTVARQKQWQFLREIAPTVRRAGYLASAANRPADEQYAPYRASMLETVKAEAAAGIEPIRMGIFGFSDIEPLLIELARRGDAGVVLSGDLILLDRQWLPSIVDMAVRLRLPTSCTGEREWAKWGCLVTYAEDWGVRSVASQIAKVLNGTKPGDLPIAQSTGQRLIVNSKTAKALNLTIPPAMLARADEVIE